MADSYHTSTYKRTTGDYKDGEWEHGASGGKSHASGINADKAKDKAAHIASEASAKLAQAQKIAGDYYGTAKEQATEAIDHLMHNETVGLLEKKLRDSNNRLYNVMDHYSDYGYRKVSKIASPYVKLPDRQPMIFSLALAALCALILFSPLIGGLIYWNHHRTLHHYAYTLNDIDVDALKKYWGDSHYLDTASHLSSQMTDNIRKLPKHSKLVRELGLLYRHWHNHNRKSKIYNTLDKISDPVYAKVHHLGSDLAERLSLAPPKHKPIFFPYLLATLAAMGGAYGLLKYGNIILGKLARSKMHPAPDTVLVSVMPASIHIPGMSPYGMKLETWLRMVKVPYQLDTSGTLSSEGKSPFIMYNGTEVPDSQICIEWLKKKLGAEDLNRDLNPKDRALSRAFRIFVEDRLKWPLVMQRFVYGSLNDILDQMHLPVWMKHIWFPLMANLFIKPNIKRRAKESGLWDRGPRFVFETAVRDINAISEFLGNKQFIMGDAPTELDASIFGMLSEFLYSFPPDHMLRTKFDSDWQNLAAYMNRMKERYWPDWDERCRTGKQDLQRY